MTRRHLIATAAGGMLAAAALVLATPTPANACGGFFCSQVPIDQSGEQIVFTVTGDTISATIQIAYAGEAEDFAWVIPVASKPEISVSPQDVFNQLRWRTQPNYYLQWDYSNGEQCGQWAYPMPGFADEDGAPTGGGVNVVESKEVGPYDTVVLESTDSHALYTWLTDNGFDQPEESIPLIDSYLKQGMLFVALKLKQGSSAGEIQPVTLEFTEQNPCVPLVLTKIAATPDMPVRIWTFGEHRAVPTNWFHVEINQKKIDWLGYGSNYEDVVTQAVNEAAGHGFATEFAGATADLSGLDQALYFEGKFDTATLAQIADPAMFVDQLLVQGFPRDSVMQALLRTHIPMPQALVDQGVTEQQFYNNLQGYSEYVSEIPFDPAAFVADLQDRVIDPLKAMQERINAHPYLTRMFTTVSPDEMTRDPLFAFNPDLPDVSNTHTAQATPVCDASGTGLDKVIITLEDGETFEIEGPFEWGYPTGGTTDNAPNEPAAKKIVLLGESGPGTIVDPSVVGEVDRKLDTQTPSSVADQVGDLLPEPGSTESAYGCDAGGSNAPLSTLALLALALVALVRRRV